MTTLRIFAFLILLCAPAFAQVSMTGAGVGAPSSGGGSLSCSYTPRTTATNGTPYTGATPSASGGTPSYTYSETGSLPTGLSISSSTGVISGTPSATGSFPSIQVKVTDSASNTANCGSSFTLVVSGSGGGPLTFAWASSNYANSTPAPPQSFAGMAIGTVSSDRIIVITIAGKGAPVTSNNIITSVTVDPGSGPVPLAQASLGGATTAASEYVWWGLVTGGGSTGTIAIGGYANGYVTSFTFNVGVLKGSATASVASVINSTPPSYSSGGTATAITVPTNGMTIISTYSDNNSPTTGVTTTYNGSAADHDQTDNTSFGQTGSMFHLNTSASMTVASTTSSAFGWAAASFQP